MTDIKEKMKRRAPHYGIQAMKKKEEEETYPTPPPRKRPNREIIESYEGVVRGIKCTINRYEAQSSIESPTNKVLIDNITF